MRQATFGVGRGVWVAPWRGPDGETILVATRRDARMVEWRMLRPGDDHVGAADDLWGALERAEPEPQLQVI